MSQRFDEALADFQQFYNLNLFEWEVLGLERCAILLDQLPYNARLYQLDTKKGWTLDAVYMDSLEFYTKVQSTKNPQRLKPLSHTFDKYKEEQTEIKPTYTKEDYARIFNHKVEEL